MTTTTTTFKTGDRVEVLRACRLPIQDVLGDGIIARITGTESEPLYWISGFLTARTGRELRLVTDAPR